jgi:hypothetical protein
MQITEREREREREREAVQKNMDKGYRVVVEKVGGTILRYWKSLWGSKFASQQDITWSKTTTIPTAKNPSQFFLIALTYCNHIRPHVMVHEGQAK